MKPTDETMKEGEESDIEQKEKEDFEVDIDYLKDFVNDLTDKQLQALRELISAKDCENRAARELNEKDDEDNDDMPMNLAMMEKKMK